jgi:hypothetical protein
MPLNELRNVVIWIVVCQEFQAIHEPLCHMKCRLTPSTTIVEQSADREADRM